MYVVFLYRENEIQIALTSQRRLKDAAKSVLECLLRIKADLSKDQALNGDLQTVQALVAQHQVNISFFVL
jgi:hypothetical protein